jgi:hypothetical protein
VSETSPTKLAIVRPLGVDQRLGRGLLCDTDVVKPYVALRSQLGDRSYLSDVLERYSEKHALSFKRLIEIVARAPKQ